VNPIYVTTAEQLQELCSNLETAALIAFDTEFVAEDTYRPELCLVQVATDEVLAVIDPLSCGSMDAFWKLLLTPDRPVIVHAGREEILFHYRSTGQTIPALFDIQLAAGFVGYDYPASYGSLVQKFTGEVLDKEETRSDWRKRPLSNRQLKYASQDVHDLPKIYRLLHAELVKRGRLEWLQEEIASRQADLASVERQEQWHRMSGIHSLNGHCLAIARALWLWRDDQARARDIPPRRVLRDDLLVELARRGTSDPKRISSLRGMEHRHLKAALDDIVAVIELARKEPIPQWPRRERYGTGQPSGMLTQFLGAALAYICRSKKIAPSIVGTADDLRDFVLYRTDTRTSDVPPPSLLQGWRATIVGRFLDDLLSGKTGMALTDIRSEMPLRFCDASTELVVDLDSDQ